MNRALACLLVLGLSVVPGLSALAATDVVITGGGWGHGIGMPQYGAKALADSGEDADEIVRYFYTGATIGEVGSGSLVNHADPLWIGVAQGRTAITIEPINGNVSMCLNGSCEFTAAPDDGYVWSVESSGGECQFYRDDTAMGVASPCEGSISWTGRPVVKVHIPELGRTYARGELLLKPAPAGKFHLVLAIDLERYLYGLGEMPSSWHPEALKAQAIAGRTYALYKAWVYRFLESNPSRMNDCACHLYSSTYDQKYIGWAKESETVGTTNYGEKWVEAVQATDGEALVHTYSVGRAIQAYYFSSSGGATENNEDAWGGAALPYLRSVSDPGPSSWTKTLTVSTILGLLASPPSSFPSVEFESLSGARILGRFESGAPTGIEISGTGASGQKSHTYTGQQLRTILGLKSHHIKSIVGFCDSTASAGDELLRFGDNGAYSIVDIAESGCVVQAINSGSYSPTWTHIEALDLTGDGDDELLFYRKSDGRYSYYELNANGTLGTQRANGFWGTGWDSVEPVNLDSDAADELMFYRKSDGRFGYYNLSAGGVIGSAVRADNFGAGWTSVEPIDFDGDGRDEMMFYRKSDGRFAYYNLTGFGFIGSSIRTGYLGTGWNRIEPIDLDGDVTDELLFYRQGDGRYAIYDLDLGGYIGSSLGLGYYDPNLVSLTSPLR